MKANYIVRFHGNQIKARINKRKEKMDMKATNIEWDVDELEDLEYLPTKIEIPDGMTDEEEISNYISDETGFCHNGYVLED